MTEQKEKKQNHQTAGFLLILAGILGITSRVIGEPDWDTIGIIKLIIPIALLGQGLWYVLKKKNSKKTPTA